MKFRLVVSGTALSDAQLATIARSIVDLGPMYQRPEFSVSFDQDEGRTRYGADPLGDLPLEPDNSCPKCGLRPRGTVETCCTGCGWRQERVKSARKPLIPFFGFWLRRPQYLVVLLLAGFGLVELVGKLLKLFAS